MKKVSYHVLNSGEYYRNFLRWSAGGTHLDMEQLRYFMLVPDNKGIARIPYYLN